MQWSKYNILSKSGKYGYLLYNTMSQVFIQIPVESIGQWLDLKQVPDNYRFFQDSGFLLKSHIIVRDNEDELNTYLTDVLKNRYNSSDMALTILPSTGCNFGCIYCYEQDRPNVNMDMDTEQAIIRFVSSNMNLKRLSIVWYGGEPLLNFESIERLSKAFQKLNIEYSAKMVSNGYLLTPEKADKLESLSIRNIQLTLDGTEEVHNMRRPLLGGYPTYEKIMTNLQYLLSVNSTVTVDIRTNIDVRNRDNYHLFYDAFKTKINDARVNLYPGFVSDLLSSECISPEYNISEGGYKAEFILDIFDKYGIEIKSFLPKFRRHSCVASKYFAFVIGPHGEVYKCWRMVGNKDKEIGNVNGISLDMGKFSRYLVGADYMRDAKCLKCEFIPLCGGGCPLVRMRNKYEGTLINHCCPEKSHMERLMDLRYDMHLIATCPDKKDVL